MGILKVMAKTMSTREWVEKYFGVKTLEDIKEYQAFISALIISAKKTADKEIGKYVKNTSGKDESVYKEVILEDADKILEKFKKFVDVMYDMAIESGYFNIKKLNYKDVVEYREDEMFKCIIKPVMANNFFGRSIRTEECDAIISLPFINSKTSAYSWWTHGGVLFTDPDKFRTEIEEKYMAELAIGLSLFAKDMSIVVINDIFRDEVLTEGVMFVDGDKKLVVSPSLAKANSVDGVVFKEVSSMIIADYTNSKNLRDVKRFRFSYMANEVNADGTVDYKKNISFIMLQSGDDIVILTE